jgi:hypothetical protein
MKLRYLPILLVGLAGCPDRPAPNAGTQASAPDLELQLKTNLAKLAPQDRKLVQRQINCPIMPDVRLGENAVPIKVQLKGEPVFVCCENCAKLARDEPEKTLEWVKNRLAQSPSPPNQK